MEYLFEFILELVFEGSIEASQNKMDKMYASHANNIVFLRSYSTNILYRIFNVKRKYNDRNTF